MNIEAQLEPYSSGHRDNDSFRVVFRDVDTWAIIKKFDFKKNEAAARAMKAGYESGYIKVEIED